jgi:hypothetical protein
MAESLKRRQRSWCPKEVADLVAEYRRSGTTQAEFVTRKGIALSTFQSWLYGRRRQSVPASAAKRAASGAECIPVRIKAAGVAGLSRPAAAGVFEVLLPSGALVRVPSGFQGEELRRLLAAVEGAC